MSTILAQLRDVAARAPDAPALLAPGRSAASFASVLAQCERIGQSLAAHNIGPGDRVIVILGNGPEMAAAFLGVAGHATCAPLNPAYTEKELEFYFDDLSPKALLCDPSLPSLAPTIARRRSIPVLEISPDRSAPAGEFSLGANEENTVTPAQASDIALILHTSGTTSRPKMVALSQANLLASARHIGQALALTAHDRCFNIMPLFHIHGLIAGLLSSLLSGASVACTSGFDPERFYAQLDACKATWITAVPTMYELIARLSRGPEHSSAKQRLRFLRSSSASLPPALMHGLEDVFGVPVIEAYGMTEAAHQMACNPLPPKQRKAGSVGCAAGPEVAIMSPTGPELLPPNTAGEIVVRGPNITSGYLGNAKANEQAFCEGWFRTGDQGRLDADGYLFITGRLKELINRGGEKISPREVDEALLALPGVRQAVVFAVPHATLGEDLAAAVVLEPKAELAASEIRRRLSVQLSPFKVPTRIVFLSEIPKGATGKVQRIGLAEKLADKLRDEYVAPTSDLERLLATLWQDVLGVAEVGVTSNFFALGGDSLHAMRISARVAEHGFALTVDAVFREPTIQALAPLLISLADPRVPGEQAPGRVRLYGFQRVILPNPATPPEHFASPTEIVLESEQPFDRVLLTRALRALVEQHDALRLRYPRSEGRISQELLPAEAVSVDHCLCEAGDQPFLAAVKTANHRFDLGQAPLLRVVVSDRSPYSLAIVAHHLVADAMSMQIVAEDFASAYDQAAQGKDVLLPDVPTPFASYLRRYDAAAKAGSFRPDAARWVASTEQCKVRDDTHGRKPFTTVGTVRYLPFDLAVRTAQIQAYARAQRMSVGEVLFAATAAGVRELAKPANHARILLLSSGRDQPLLGNLARTVGCLVNIIPVIIDLTEAHDFHQTCNATRAALAALPSAGFSLSAMLSHEPIEIAKSVGQMIGDCQALFNYKGALGPRSAPALGASRLRARPCTYRPENMISHIQSPDALMGASFGFQAHYELADGKLFGDFYYSHEIYQEEDILRLRSAVRAALDTLSV